MGHIPTEGQESTDTSVFKISRHETRVGHTEDELVWRGPALRRPEKRKPSKFESKRCDHERSGPKRDQLTEYHPSRNRPSVCESRRC